MNLFSDQSDIIPVKRLNIWLCFELSSLGKNNEIVVDAILTQHDARIVNMLLAINQIAGVEFYGVRKHPINK